MMMVVMVVVVMPTWCRDDRLCLAWRLDVPIGRKGRECWTAGILGRVSVIFNLVMVVMVPRKD